MKYKNIIFIILISNLFLFSLLTIFPTQSATYTHTIFLSGGKINYQYNYYTYYYHSEEIKATVGTEILIKITSSPEGGSLYIVKEEDFTDNPDELRKKAIYKNNLNLDTSWNVPKSGVYHFVFLNLSQNPITCNYSIIVLDSNNLISEPNLDPIANLKLLKVTEEETAITLDASESHDPDGNIVRYLWDFGDGKTQTSSSAKIFHKYESDGNYSVVLTVFDDKGYKSTTSLDVSLDKNNIKYPDLLVEEVIKENYNGLKIFVKHVGASEYYDGPIKLNVYNNDNLIYENYDYYFIRKNETDYITIPNVLKTGTNTIKILIDKENYIKEENENNNNFEIIFNLADETTKSYPDNTSKLSTTKTNIYYILIVFAIILISIFGIIKRKKYI